MNNTNPPVVLGMTLDQFNAVQAILAKRPFEEVADLIINFRRQIEMQIQKLREEEQAEMARSGPPQAPQGRPRLADVSMDQSAD